MDMWVFNILGALLCLGYFCLGCMVGLNNSKKWKIKAIEMEHYYSRLLNKTPKTNSELETCAWIIK